VSTSLIISSRDRPAFLERAISALMNGTKVPDELIVIDQSDAANDALIALADSPGTCLRYVVSEERGLSRGRNLGITTARSEWVLFVDDDVIVSPEWFERLSEAINSAGPRVVITGRVLSGDPEFQGAFAPSLSPSEKWTVHRGRPGTDLLSLGNAAIPRVAFEEVGLFDTRLGPGSRFPSSEDNDLGFRLLEAGYSIVYDPAIVVTHRAWRARRALLPLRWSYGRGQGAYFAKHASRRDRYMLDRLRHDFWHHVRRAPVRGAHNFRDGAADLVYSAALVAGALDWVITSRGR
jgi:GT2 family glycosyltransferase